eukprot:gnl/MRDRNA2_/MRDRNA2_91436_c0_seq1.p1 gnl/MRDRNA2_/MRDRNA2_91436_c0~~gnl/MRDRNA2_/MRDRNA2_91436_c0_seq1.p1  ORF type:complete len:242 (+),score=31.42 gnl/MRDRNA2_/MRDRNA2_91436_c0_seq1:71-796(+)
MGVASSAKVDGIGGFYTDPNHYRPGTWAGTRMVSDSVGDKSGDAITLIGSDDGTEFWAVTGEWTNKKAGKFLVDFSPKGGPADVEGKFSDTGTLTWPDGNHWTRQASPQFKVAPLLPGKSTSDIGGFYTDPNHYKPGGFAGTRMVSDSYGNKEGGVLRVMGSDDGTHFWTVFGHYQDKTEGKFGVDFSPKGGPADLAGTFDQMKQRLVWPDGNSWTKVSAARGDSAAWCACYNREAPTPRG